MAKRQSSLQKQINRVTGVSSNANGAGNLRLVAKRDKETGKVIEGKTQAGSRNQRYRDIRAAQGLSTG